MKKTQTKISQRHAIAAATLVALCGADMDARAAGVPLPANRPVLLEKGTVLRTGRATLGSRAYLAVAGGFPLPPVLGSRSTYLPAKFGDMEETRFLVDAVIAHPVREVTPRPKVKPLEQKVAWLVDLFTRLERRDQMLRRGV